MDAFFNAHPFAYFELYQTFNRSQIAISSTRYEGCRDSSGPWLHLNEQLRQLSRVQHNVIGANNLYDREYIRCVVVPAASMDADPHLHLQ